jgi:hypothetical protein
LENNDLNDDAQEYGILESGQDGIESGDEIDSPFTQILASGHIIPYDHQPRKRRKDDTQIQPNTPVVQKRKRKLDITGRHLHVHGRSEDTDPTNTWCKCGCCIQMKPDHNCICCIEETGEIYQEYLKDPKNASAVCFANSFDFETYVLAKKNLDRCLTQNDKQLRQRITVSNGQILNRTADRYRWAAYSTYIDMIHPNLGAGNRIPLPSCCLIAIRKKYPNEDGSLFTEFDPKIDPEEMSYY